MSLTLKVALNVVDKYASQNWETFYGSPNVAGEVWKELRSILDDKLAAADLKIVLLRSHSDGEICKGLAVPKDVDVHTLLRKHLAEFYPGVVHISYVFTTETLQTYGPLFDWPAKLDVRPMSMVVEV